jgi:hypothetical protein
MTNYLENIIVTPAELVPYLIREQGSTLSPCVGEPARGGRVDSCSDASARVQPERRNDRLYRVYFHRSCLRLRRMTNYLIYKNRQKSCSKMSTNSFAG